MDANKSVFVSEDGGDERVGKMAVNGGQPTNKRLNGVYEDYEDKY